MVSAFKAADMLNGRSAQQYTADLLEWQNQVFDRILTMNPNLPASIRNSQRIPLHYLPIEEQIAQVGRYREISGLDAVLLKLAGRDAGTPIPPELLADALGSETRARDIHNITEGLRTIKGRESDSPYFKIPVSYKPGEHPAEAVLAGMNLSYNPRVSDLRSGIKGSQFAHTAASHFGTGPYSIRAISEDFFNMPNQLKPGAKFLSFDIETAGLMQGQIREVGYRTGAVSATGAFDQGRSSQLLFDPVMMHRGTVGRQMEGSVRPVSISDFLRSGSSSPISDDFAKSMVPFLKSMQESDYIIGHNIQSFDLPQVYEQLIQTKAYRAKMQHVIPGFKELVDTTFAGLGPKIVDTLTLAQRSENLLGLTVNPQLMRMGAAQPYSISNLLLQTDLGERIGTEKLKGLLAGGLHNAAIDDVVTGGILQHLNDLKLNPLTDPDMINKILSSSAITPMTKASVHSDISDRALKHLIANVDNGVFVPNTSDANRGLAALIQNARAGDTSDLTQAFNQIRSGVGNGLSFNITPIEQQVFETRNLGLGIKANFDSTFDPSSYVFRTNLFDEMAFKGVGRRRHEKFLLGQRSDISSSEFSAFQTKMKSLQMPFAGLSLEERRFGTALSHLTSGVNPRAQPVASLISDTLVSSFEMFNPDNVQYVTASGRSSLPISLLQEFGGIKEGDLLGLSVVDRTLQSKKSAVNLVYKFDSQDAADVFATRLERLAKAGNQQIASSLGLDVSVLTDESDAFVLDVVGKFKTAVEKSGLPGTIREMGAKEGISIGQLYGDQANPVIELLRQLNGNSQLRDESMLPMRLPFASAQMIDSTTGRGVVQTAGAILDSGLTPANLPEIGKQVSMANTVYGGFIEMGANAKYTAELDAARLAANMGEAGSDIIRTAFENFQRVKPHIPKVLGIGAFAALGIHQYRKHKENEPYNALFDRQEPTSTETYNVSRLLQQKMDAGIDMSRQGYNPLATAFVVDNLNNDKIGHTNMSSNKNASLYGGVI